MAGDVTPAPSSSLRSGALTRVEAPSGASTESKHNTYGQILKSSALIGGSSVVTLAVSIVRAKSMAVLLGPAGVGMMGLYWSVLELAQNIAGLGVNSSGVRQIADAHASGDPSRIANTAAVLSRTSISLGLLGAIVLAALSYPISLWTFGTADMRWGIVVLSLGVLLRLVSDGQSAAMQGMRRIGDLARKNVVAAAAASGATVLLVYVLGERGIVPSLVATMGITLLVSWWYSRKIDLPTASALSFRQLRDEAWPLLSLGMAFMASTVLTTAAAYAIRIIVRDAHGVAAAGLYQSAWAIGGIYVGFILQAMGSDFYPRLTAAIRDHDVCNRLVNEQARVGILMAGPGVIATVALAPVIISILYHETFSAAVEPLRWICIGMALRVVAWPMGYILLAKNARLTYLAVEVAACIVHVGLAVLLVPRLGVVGAAMAFAGLYVWHSLLVYVIVRRLTGFAWSADNVRTGSLVIALVAAVFVVCQQGPARIAVPFGVVVAVGSGLHAIRQLSRLVPMSRVPQALQVALRKVRLVSTPA